MKRIDRHTNGWRQLMMVALLALGLSLPFASVGHAAPPAATNDTCTDSPIYDVFLETRLDSILMDIVDLIGTALQGVTENLYFGIVASANYQSAVAATITLFIAFYGVGFIFGWVPPNFSQALIRVIKIGIVGGMMTPAGWVMFHDTVVRVFGATWCDPLFGLCEQSGVDWLIDQMILMGGGNPAQGHFSIMEPIMIKVFSPKMFIMIIGSLSTGPFGPIMAMALGWSVVNLFMMILKALEIYLLSLIVRTLLLGLGPIFFAMMFFERTKQIFMGYINQLVSFSLQPVLLFAFLAFFVTMINSAVDQLMAPGEIELCYTKMEHMGKLQYDIQHWRFKVDGQIYEGEWTWQGCVNCPPLPFPINIIDILIFLILCHIGIKMSTIAVQIAAEIAQASIRLTDVPNTLSGWFRGAGADSSGTGMDLAKRSLVK